MEKKKKEERERERNKFFVFENYSQNERENCKFIVRWWK